MRHAAKVGDDAVKRDAVDCLFCQLVCGDLPRHQVYEDERFLVLLTREYQPDKASIT